MGCSENILAPPNLWLQHIVYVSVTMIYRWSTIMHAKPRYHKHCNTWISAVLLPRDFPNTLYDVASLSHHLSHIELCVQDIIFLSDLINIKHGKLPFTYRWTAVVWGEKFLICLFEVTDCKILKIKDKVTRGEWENHLCMQSVLDKLSVKLCIIISLKICRQSTLYLFKLQINWWSNPWFFTWIITTSDFI